VNLKAFYVALLSVLATVIVLSMAWEFWLEEWLLPGIVSHQETESSEERWEFVVTAGVFTFLALIGPTVIGTKMIWQSAFLGSNNENPARVNRGGAGLVIPGLLRNDVGSAWAFLSLLNVEGYRLSFSQRLKTATLDCTVVNEDVFGTVRRCNEAEAFLVTKPLNCTCSHFGYL